MALQVNWTNATTQVEVLNAYARVNAIHVDAISMTIELVVGLYPNAEVRDMPGTVPFDTYRAWPGYVEFLGVPVDVRSASYQYLKTLTPFVDAVDV